MVEQIRGQVVLKRTDLHIRDETSEGEAKSEAGGPALRLVVFYPPPPSHPLPSGGGAHLGHTAQVVALEVVSLLCREVVRRPALVRVAVVVLHDVLSRHGDRRQGEAGRRRHGGHVHRGHFGLEAKLVVWQLEGETGLRP